MMRPAIALVLLAACGGPRQPATKRPNSELIVGEFERHPPDGTTAARFGADGSVIIAHTRAELDSKTLATGTYALDKDRLTLDYSSGEMCKGQGPGVYRVVISRIGIRFTRVSDRCDQRSKLDGQTWFRVR
ncbi:MAG TPA: hypothetical protein VLX92_29600 [Kofleriaceae bacterium]|nr:hypothetical protein [Kofleriaceae bacterium]